MNKTILMGLRIIIGILNLIAGVLMTLLFLGMQSIIGLVFGMFYIVFGVLLIAKKNYHELRTLLFYIIVPVTALFSLNIMLLVISKDVPSYYRTPLWIGLIIILPFWLVILANSYILKKAGAEIPKLSEFSSSLSRFFKDAFKDSNQP